MKRSAHISSHLIIKLDFTTGVNCRHVRGGDLGDVILSSVVSVNHQVVAWRGAGCFSRSS